MKNFNLNKFILIQIFLLFGLLSAGCSTSAERLIQYGNKDYAKQLYEDALEAYQEAQIESPQLAQPYYNAANVFYRQGDYFQAFEQLSKALKFAKEDSLRQYSFYNLGNNSYNSQELDSAVEAYKAALLLDSNDQDAKYNLELSLQRQEQQQQEQEQHQQDQEQQQQQNQDENSENNGSESETDQQDSQNEGSNQQNQQEQERGHQEPNQELESSQEQDDDSENLQEGDQENTNRNEELNGEDPQNENQQEGSQENHNQSEGQIPSPGQKMTPEQAKQLLAAIAQNSQTLQEYLGQILFVQELPPIQDW